ncbi:MAG TPA: alpha/beta hydrolase [Ilumatobacteraceae bacterium]|nr:alpha/beta hydrolase [Ilumatobacteraceae bacterium]
MNGAVKLHDGRSVGIAEFGAADGDAVLWCHGGPGSRLEPAWLDDEARAAGLRVIGIDRPGYGDSPPAPGRTIVDGARDLLAVADHLGLDRFATVGVSTGGAYSLATAAVAPDRVSAVVACCSMTDMSYGPARSTMSPAHALDVWDAPDRDAAIVAATAAHGPHGEKLQGSDGVRTIICAEDRALFADAHWMGHAMAAFPAMFRWGLEGYADDRIADGAGWIDFDVNAIRCPVTVLHGTLDAMCQPVHAEHTASIVPNARLRMMEGHGHFSIEAFVIPTLKELLAGDHPG